MSDDLTGSIAGLMGVAILASVAGNILGSSKKKKAKGGNQWWK